MTDYRQQVREVADLIKGEDMSYADMARLVDKSPQNLHNQIHTGRIKAWELFRLAESCGKKIVVVDAE